MISEIYSLWAFGSLLMGGGETERHGEHLGPEVRLGEREGER